MPIRAPHQVLSVICLGFAAAAIGCGQGGAPDPVERNAAEPPTARPAGDSVATTGKQEAPIAALPEAVLAAARRSRPELTVEAAEHEVRDGREYYDLAGTLPDGSELELDMTRVGGAWTVVEVQRDLPFEAVPEPVRAVLPSAWRPARIIESDQGEGVVIYEFFGPGPDGAEVKREVRWAQGTAELLEDEWMH